MAINISFNGSTIWRPGSYSRRDIDLGGGFPLSPTGLIGIFGEAVAGAPGSAVPNLANNVFSPEQFPQIKQIYRGGPIVDACNFLFAPGADGAIPSGAQAIYIYKTNLSTKATLALPNTWGTLESNEYGVGGNRLTFSNTLVPATSASVTSSTAFDLTGGAGVGKLLTFAVQGSATTYTFTAPSGMNTASLMTTALAAGANWAPSAPTGITFTVGGTDSAATLTIARVATGTPNREGMGRNFAIVAGTTGLATFHLTAGLVVASAENAALVTVTNTRDLVTETATVGGSVVIKIGRLGGTTPTVTINATQILLKNNGTAEYTLNLADFNTIQQVVDFITASTSSNWLAAIGSTLFGQMPPTVLDEVTDVGASAVTLDVNSLPAQIKRDAADVLDFFAQSASVSLPIPGASAACGLLDTVATVYLTGGARGPTTTADITNALTALQRVRVNAVIPLFSRNFTPDIADGLTDASSTYTIAGVHQAVKTHCSLMATTKARSERQGYLSIKDTYANCKVAAQTLADFRSQLTIQDVRQVNSDGGIQWFQPWAFACMLAGARGGSPIGLPMTNKYLNVSGIRQTAQAMTTAEAKIVEDFNPDTMYEDAIRNGITFMERPQSGGFRVVVDNTTYGRDGNWVYNRAHVLYAADVLEYDFRTQLQNIYVGVKNTVSAAEIQATCESLLVTYLGQGITVSTPDAKQGFKQLVVQISGSTVNVSVSVKLVEGIDYVLNSISFQRAVSST